MPEETSGALGYLPVVSPRRFPTLATTLHDRGHRTAGVFSGPYLEPYRGFGRGFDRRRVAAASRELSPLDEQIRVALERGPRAPSWSRPSDLTSRWDTARTRS